MKEIFEKNHRELTFEDLQRLANAPLSVTKKYFQYQETVQAIRALRLKLPKLMRTSTQQKYMEDIEVLEKDLNKIIETIY